jgi:hypothetical protein
MSSSNNLFPGIPLVESPLFQHAVDGLGLTTVERAIALQLHEQGFALIDFPDVQIEQRTKRMKGNLASAFQINFDDPLATKNDGLELRVQDAWKFDDDVKQVAANQNIIALLSKIYGRRAFPFQTLNFPVGTQQSLHSDSIHFSSIPERFMCGVWLALEDVTADAGPLMYIPGSHKWPILSNAVIGRSGDQNRGRSAQDPFQAAWQALIDASGIERESFLPKKGQALIWAANLLHGGDRQIDPTRTRWSQVTHYYFDNCIYYTPAFSDEPLGDLDLRTITNIATGEIEPNMYLDEEVRPLATKAKPKRYGRRLWPKEKHWLARFTGRLPPDFDASAYVQLHPDVAASTQDPADHFLRHGRREGRSYRIT